MEVNMLLNGKLKRIALLAAVDVCLKRTSKSPKRCARNMIELGTSAFPGKITEAQKSELYDKLLSYFESNDASAARELFSSVFL